MKALVEFIEQYRPGFSQEVVPADEIDIALLEKHAGPLPGAYRRFLPTMGASMGDLELAEADFAIDGNIGTYLAMRWLRHGRLVSELRRRGRCHRSAEPGDERTVLEARVRAWPASDGLGQLGRGAESRRAAEVRSLLFALMSAAQSR